KTIEVGEILSISSDDGAIILDMPAWCNSNGHEYLGEEKLEEIEGYIVYVRKGERKRE
ncbi:MAG: sulfurtransferase TusA family protein, partial [Candidatus Marinimicrobia bacterium]|nr:sulfurtransferase TusA family protein [Candidatus Neomarinimicrobiota bacterium]